MTRGSALFIIRADVLTTLRDETLHMTFYSESYAHVLKTAGLSDIKDRFLEAIGLKEKEPSNEAKALAAVGTAGAGAAAYGLTGDIVRATDGALTRNQTSEADKLLDRLDALYKSEIPEPGVLDPDAVYRARHGIDKPRYGLQAKIRELTNRPDMGFLANPEGYIYGVAETSPGNRLHVIGQGPGKLNVASMLHEAGHATAPGGGVREAFRRLYHVPFRGSAGALAGGVMALSGNEDAEAWAPAVGAAAFTPELVEEARANLNADRYVRQLSNLVDNPKELIRDARKMFGMSYGAYLAAPAIVAGGLYALPRVANYMQESMDS